MTINKNRMVLLTFSGFCLILCLVSFTGNKISNPYSEHYKELLNQFKMEEIQLLETINSLNPQIEEHRQIILQKMRLSRKSFKKADFWLRYLNPLAHKKINGPLAVEWETEVFEKYEKPYKREGAGFTLAYQLLQNDSIPKDELLNLMEQARQSTETFLEDSMVNDLQTFDHFYFCNRLFLLNLAAIYSTGFECPDQEQVIPEMEEMMTEIKTVYQLYNKSFPEQPINSEYLKLYDNCLLFVNKQPRSNYTFDHFTFIQKYINPLFGLNQKMILKYHAFSRNLLDYSLNKQSDNIFSKNLYSAQNTKGIFLRLEDSAMLKQLEKLGRTLFFDPILSQNNERSCASCHHPEQYFTDTLHTTSLHFNQQDTLPRNTPTLINASFQHLLMADGSHYTLLDQSKGVMTNPNEMASNENELVSKVMSCKDYSKTFKQLLPYTPTEKEINLTHISSALTYYYGKFSQYLSPFDLAMNQSISIKQETINGFNIFMGKAQCGTCHFAPQFNGVKPPYIGSEFEVIGIPKSLAFKELSNDSGRYGKHPAKETLHAFRTNTLRNIAKTKPYMHNGVFNSLESIIDFYNSGGGIGIGLDVPNQTLSGDSLKLSPTEKANLISFLESLTETIPIEKTTPTLPKSSNKLLNKRQLGGIY